MAHLRRGTYSQAQNLFMECLAIQMDTLGDSHPKVATTYTSLGDCLHGIGDLHRAARYYEDALAIQMTTIGKNHCDTDLTRRKLGRVLCKLDDEVEGELA